MPVDRNKLKFLIYAPIVYMLHRRRFWEDLPTKPRNPQMILETESQKLRK